MGVHRTIYSVTESDVPLVSDAPEKISRFRRYSLIEVLETNPAFHLGKAWDATHFSLGDHEDDHPLAFIESGGQDIPALDDGMMSSARYFSASLVVAIRKAIDEVSDDELARNFARRDEVEDPETLYPTGLRPFEIDDVLHEMKELRRFLAEVVAASRGIVIRTEG